MKSVDAQIKRKMALAFTVLFVGLAFPTFRLMFSDHTEIPLALCALIGCPAIFSLLPLACLVGQQRASKKLLERAQELEAYRASPESHLLHLND